MNRLLLWFLRRFAYVRNLEVCLESRERALLNFGRFLGTPRRVSSTEDVAEFVRDTLAEVLPANIACEVRVQCVAFGQLSVGVDLKEGHVRG
jgi:hypothetical protein